MYFQTASEFLYHYTNESGKNGILTNGLIQASQSKEGDAVLGEGVYLTELGPEHGKATILRNNYGKHSLTKGKADYYFEFISIQLKGVHQSQVVDGRIVWRFPKSIDLDSVRYSYGETERSCCCQPGRSSCPFWCI